MSILSKKLFIFMLAASLLLPFELNKTEAVSTTLSKTVEFFIGQDGETRPSGEQFSFYFNNVVIPETPTVKSAIIEISGVSYNNSGDQTINIDLEQGAAPAGSGIDYALNGTTKPKSFTFKHDAWQNGAGPMSNIASAGSYDYTLYLKGVSAGGTGAYSISSAKLILTYDYSSSGADFLKTNKFFVVQETGNTADGTAVSKDFIIDIREQSPAIQSVFIETSGIAKGSGVGTLGVSVTNQGSPAVYTNYNLDLSSSSRITRFTVRHDASTTILSGDFPGNKTYTLHLKGTGFSINLWSAKIVITYKYTANTASLPISGYLISSTFDTGATEGAAFNSLMWLGNLNGGKVRMQFASSDCPNGQADFPACAAGTWEYYGSGCTSAASDAYAMDIPNSPKEIGCPAIHNNKRYFRYKIILCSNDCATAGANNPEVTDVIINWAP